MGQILGSLQNVEIDVAGGSSYKNLVCLRTSSVNTTVDSTTEQTNCGPLTSVADATMGVDFDAICEVSPSVSQHQFTGYITSLTLNQSTTEFINFSGTVTSTGIVDVTA